MSASTDLTRRDVLRQSAGVTLGAVAASTGATAQQNGTDPGSGDGSSSDDGPRFEPPDAFLGSSTQAIGASPMLMNALEDDGCEGGDHLCTMAGFVEWAGGAVPQDLSLQSSTSQVQADMVLKLDTMGNRDGHVLIPLWNNLAQSRNAAWLNGLVAFIEAVEAGKTESETIADAKAAVEEYYTIPRGNLYRYWQEQMNELEGLWSVVSEAFSSPEDYLMGHLPSGDIKTADGDNVPHVDSVTGGTLSFSSESFSLPDGSSIELNLPQYSVDVKWSDTQNGYAGTETKTYTVRPGEIDLSTSKLSHMDTALTDPDAIWVLGRTDAGLTTFWGKFDSTLPTTHADATSDGRDFSSYPVINKFHIIDDGIEQELNQMRDNVVSFAQSAYGEIATGELSVQEIVASNPMLAASEYSSDYGTTGHYSYAAASMAAMGMSYDLEHAMVIELHNGTQLEGTILLTEGDFSVSTGETVDPSARWPDATVQFAFDAGSASRELATDGYRATIDGGIAQLKVAPKGGTQYRITTAAGETAEVDANDWVPESEQDHIDPDATTTYTVDLSPDLENPITEIESIVHHYPEGTGDSIITIRNEFTVLEAYNRETGESVDTVDAEDGQDLEETEVEWTQEDLEFFKETMENIHDESGETSSGGGGWLDWNGWPDVIPDGSSGLLMWAAGGAVGVVGLSKLLDGGNDGRAR